VGDETFDTEDIDAWVAAYHVRSVVDPFVMTVVTTVRGGGGESRDV